MVTSIRTNQKETINKQDTVEVKMKQTTKAKTTPTANDQ